jgi:membrane carboxypeptidase/penicillin-binding protein
MINLAAFYAAVANEGARISPYAIDSIEQNGKPVYRRHTAKPTVMASGDRAAFYQLRSILEGVVARGTAASIKHLTHIVGGKTGTTDNENDAWFVGFTSDVTVAVWIGYDNAGGKRTLGHGQTGGKVALPIAERIIEASWAYQAPKSPLPPPSAEIANSLKALPIDLNSGQRMASAKRGNFLEYFRLDKRKRPRDTRHALVGRRHTIARSEPRPAPQAGEDRNYRQHGSDPRLSQHQAPPQRRPRTLRELFGF